MGSLVGGCREGGSYSFLLDSCHSSKEFFVVVDNEDLAFVRSLSATDKQGIL